ncbi:hypothetical protein [Natrarchaeobius chitinivorans]|nr:hypothetical protein [Natrarchaeobius chitinivorans]
MTDDRFDGVIENAVDRYGDLDADWKGVLVGAVIVALVGIAGVDIPW